MKALPVIPLFEVVALKHSAEVSAPNALQVAANRWLISGQEPLLEEGFFSVTNVTGKWREFRLTASTGLQILASSIDVQTILEKRHCARTSVLGCPAIIQAVEDGYVVWIERSYEAAFGLAVQQTLSL